MSIDQLGTSSRPNGQNSRAEHVFWDEPFLYPIERGVLCRRLIGLLLNPAFLRYCDCIYSCKIPSRHKILIISSILFLLMVVSSGLRNVRVRSTTITIASAAVITLLFLPLTVFAQQQEEETAFLPYENPTYGIFMQYPSNWAASTSGLADHTDVVAFYSPLQNVSDLSQARLIISVILYSQNVSLQEYTNYLGTILNQSEQVDVRNSSEVTVAGHPGHRVVLANQPAQNTTLTFYQMNTWTTIGNKVYLLTYQGEEPAFNQYLPEVSRMLESLSIRSNNNMTTTAADIENQVQ